MRSIFRFCAIALLFLWVNPALAQFDHVNPKLLQDHGSYAGAWGGTKINLSGSISPLGFTQFIGVNTLSKSLKGGLGGYYRFIGEQPLQGTLGGNERELMIFYAPKFSIKDRLTISPSFHTGISHRNMIPSSDNWYWNYRIMWVMSYMMWMRDETSRMLQRYGAGLMVNSRNINVGYQLSTFVDGNVKLVMHSLVGNWKFDRNPSNGLSSTIGLNFRLFDNNRGTPDREFRAQVPNCSIRWKNLVAGYRGRDGFTLGYRFGKLDVSCSWMHIAMNRMLQVGASYMISKNVKESRKNGLTTLYK